MDERNKTEPGKKRIESQFDRGRSGRSGGGRERERDTHFSTHITHGSKTRERRRRWSNNSAVVPAHKERLRESEKIKICATAIQRHQSPHRGKK